MWDLVAAVSMPGRGVKPDVETSTGTMVTSTMDWEMGSRSVAEMVKEGGGVLSCQLD